MPRKHFGLDDAPVIAFVILLICLSLAGGASRSDALGQALVRPVAAGTIVVAILTGADGWRRIRHSFPGVALLFVAAVGIPLVQLIPLPPSLWTVLPGRAPLAELAGIAGFTQPWRPIALVPDGARNALFSLIVPAAILVLIASVPRRRLAWLPGALVSIAVVSAIVGLMQFGNAFPDNPFINEVRGEPSGLLANRNHQALLAAMGIIAVPVWANAAGGVPPVWRAATAAGLAVFLAISIVATGSRMGLLLLALALALTAAFSVRTIGQLTSRWPPRLRYGAFAMAVLFLMTMGWLVIHADRAVSIDRLAMLQNAEDIRWQALPTILAIVRTYFPVGAGLGSFDAMFRMAEPFDLLDLTYLNHAHDDFVEVALETGVLGICLIAGALWWVARSTLRLRWVPAGADRARGILGAGIITLTLIASTTDYPARTPLVMALVMIAACWLARAIAGSGPPARSLYGATG